MKRTITLAKTAGFCFGVARAVDLVYQLVGAGEPVTTLGPIIHNPQLVQDLAQKGCQAVDDPLQAGDRTLIIRSHGVGRQVYELLERNHIRYRDATCPFVAKIHRIVSEHSAAGNPVIIIGDKSHPEVQGIIGHCTGPCFAAQNMNELIILRKEFTNEEKNDIIVVAQTTFRQDLWNDCCEYLKKHYTNIKIFDTICNATNERQSEAAALARSSDLMVVVGGRHSSNTAKLLEVCRTYCPALLVETAAELDRELLLRSPRIGVTAGASTPADIIKEVLQTMSEMIKNQDEELNFAELLEQSMSEKLYNGKRVKGVVTSIAPNEVQIDINAKQAGFIPLSELTDDPNLRPSDIVEKGQELDLIVIKVNDQEGTVMLSKKRCDSAAGFDTITEAYENGTVLEGVVTDVVRGGVLVLSNYVKIFIPASLVSNTRVEDLNTLLKQTVRFKVIEIKENSRKAVGSVRAVLNEEKAAKAEAFWNQVEVGQVYKGAVKSLTSYGAFVDLGGVDGMVHITELSWQRIKHPSEVVNVGDFIEVYVKDVDKEKKKISLGYKKTEDNPWEIFKNKYAVGDVVTAKIVSLTQFGAFAQIIPGVDGLIHISQLSTQRVAKAADVVSVGQEVDVKIIGIDLDAKRISLSIRALLEEKEAAEQAQIMEEAAAANNVTITSDEETAAEEPEEAEEAPAETEATAEEATAEADTPAEE